MRPPTIDPEDRMRDDELLSAYLDGELGADEAARLRARLARDPALAARLEAFKAAETTLRRSYEALDDEPLPRAVLDLLEAGTEPREQAAPRETERPGDVVELRPRARSPRRWFSLPAAVAAGVALIVGLLVGELIGPRGSAPPSGDLLAAGGAVARGTRLYDVLQSVPSAETRRLGAAVTATPRLTFRAHDGGYCRQVDLASERGTTETLACRHAGEWRIEVAAFSAAAPEPDGVYRPAAGESTPVREAVDTMIEGDPLGAEAERRLIANDWSRSP